MSIFDILFFFILGGSFHHLLHWWSVDILREFGSKLFPFGALFPRNIQKFISTIFASILFPLGAFFTRNIQMSISAIFVLTPQYCCTPSVKSCRVHRLHCLIKPFLPNLFFWPKKIIFIKYVKKVEKKISVRIVSSVPTMNKCCWCAFMPLWGGNMKRPKCYIHSQFCLKVFKNTLIFKYLQV